MIRIPNLRHVRENHAIALFQSGQDFDRAHGCATELDMDSRRSIPVAIEFEKWNFLVLCTVYRPPDLQNVVNLFDIDSAVHFEACLDSVGSRVERDVDRASLSGAR